MSQTQNTITCSHGRGLNCRICYDQTYGLDYKPAAVPVTVIPVRDIVLASINPPSVWNFFETIEAALVDQARANAYNVELQAHGAPKRHYEPMEYTAYKAAERAFYLLDEPAQITREKFYQMLGVLPPMNWHSTLEFESFLMSEFWSGSYTHQYVRRGEGEAASYWSKMVDAADRTTWMKAVEA